MWWDLKPNSDKEVDIMNEKTINIILANAPINNGNRGCVALSLLSILLLDKLLSEKDVTHAFYLPQSGFPGKEKHSYKAGDVQADFFSLTDISSSTLTQHLKKLYRYKEYKETQKIYRNADFILDIGQGDSFADIYGNSRFDWIYSQYRLGMKYRKPYCILPQTIGPFRDPKIREQARKGMEYASCVMVRDRQSRDFVGEMLPGKEVAEIIDVAFFMPYTRKEFDRNFVHVGLNVSALLWHGGYTGDNQFGLKADYPSLVRSVMDHFLKQEDVKVHLIPHVVGGERHIENDYAVSYDLFEEYNHPNLVLSPLFLDPIAAKNYIAGMDFFMGTRMHATIAAFSSGVPVVPMAYSRKFNGLFADTLQYPFMADIKTQTADKAHEIVKQAFAQRGTLKAVINKQMDTTVEQRRLLLERKLNNFLKLE